MTEHLCFPRIIVNAPGALLELPALLAQLGYKSPMILSGHSPTELKSTTHLSQQLELFRVRHSVFDDIPEAPHASDITRNVRRFFSGGDQMIPNAFDVIVAIGNASLMTLAQAIGRECGEIPLITVPLTLDQQHASGAEHQPASAPVAVIHDSHLLSQTPLLQQLNGAAATLLQTLDYLSAEQSSLFNEQQIYTVIRLLNSNLTTLIAQPSETEARAALQLAGNLAGTIASNSRNGALGMVNQAICTHHQLPLNTVLPEILSLGISTAAGVNPDRFSACARALPLNTVHRDDESAALQDRLQQLITLLRLPDMNYFGIPSAALEAQFAAMQGAPEPIRSIFNQLIKLYKN